VPEVFRERLAQLGGAPAEPEGAARSRTAGEAVAPDEGRDAMLRAVRAAVPQMEPRVTEQLDEAAAKFESGLDAGDLGLVGEAIGIIEGLRTVLTASQVRAPREWFDRQVAAMWSDPRLQDLAAKQPLIARRALADKLATEVEAGPVTDRSEGGIDAALTKLSLALRSRATEEAARKATPAAEIEAQVRDLVDQLGLDPATVTAAELRAQAHAAETEGALFQRAPRVPIEEVDAANLAGSVARFVERSQAPGAASVVLRLGTVEPGLAARIAKDAGVDVAGFDHVMQSDEARHILKRHGVGAPLRSDELPVTVADLARVPEIIATADSVVADGTTHQGLPVLRFTKREADGTSVVVEEVRTKRRRLSLKTMRRKRTGGGTEAEGRGGPEAPDAPAEPAPRTLRPSRESGNAPGSDLAFVEAEDKARPDASGRGFQQRTPEGPRGSITFLPDGRTLIQLFEGADLSTVLHEAAHLFLEVFADVAGREGAPAELGADWQTLLDWFGVKSRAEIGTEQHEKFARGFEAYLMEGKAPSIELQGVFDRFRAWLTRIYRSLKAMGADVTPEVRRVFDRMLATDQAIREAEAASARPSGRRRRRRPAPSSPARSTPGPSTARSASSPTARSTASRRPTRSAA
jgi:hypothetical protein